MTSRVPLSYSRTVHEIYERGVFTAHQLQAAVVRDDIDVSKFLLPDQLEEATHLAFRVQEDGQVIEERKHGRLLVKWLNVPNFWPHPVLEASAWAIIYTSRDVANLETFFRLLHGLHAVCFLHGGFATSGEASAHDNMLLFVGLSMWRRKIPQIKLSQFARINSSSECLTAHIDKTLARCVVLLRRMLVGSEQRPVSVRTSDTRLHFPPLLLSASVGKSTGSVETIAGDLVLTFECAARGEVLVGDNFFSKHGFRVNALSNAIGLCYDIKAFNKALGLGYFGGMSILANCFRVFAEMRENAYPIVDDSISGHVMLHAFDSVLEFYGRKQPRTAAMFERQFSPVVARIRNKLASPAFRADTQLYTNTLPLVSGTDFFGNLPNIAAEAWSQVNVLRAACR